MITSLKKYVQPKHLFMISVLLVNGGNYIYNLVLGRILGHGFYRLSFYGVFFHVV